jgi:hypothetical protein
VRRKYAPEKPTPLRGNFAHMPFKASAASDAPTGNAAPEAHIPAGKRPVRGHLFDDSSSKTRAESTNNDNPVRSARQDAFVTSGRRLHDLTTMLRVLKVLRLRLSYL